MARHLGFGPKRERLDIGWVTPDWCVGAAPDVDLLPAVIKEGISSVLDLRAETTPDPDVFSRCGLRLLYLPVQDGDAPSEEQFAQGTSWVLSEVAAGRRVLVCCKAGRGRSVTLACAVLLAMGYPLSEVLPLVARKRQSAQPTEAQVSALQAITDRFRHRVE